MRHYWHPIDGRKVSVKAQCNICGCVRESTGNQTSYYRGGVTYQTAPPCKHFNELSEVKLQK